MIIYNNEEYDINILNNFDGVAVYGNSNNKFKCVSNLDNIVENSLVYCESYNFLLKAVDSKASYIICKPENFSEYNEKNKINEDKTFIVFPYPKIIFTNITALFKKRVSITGEVGKYTIINSKIDISTIQIGNFTVIGEDDIIGKNTYIGNNVTIGSNVKIGENCYIYDNVTLYDYIEIGDGTIIHSGTVIGSDGFGYQFNGKEHQKIEQLGKVIIGRDCEIGANCCIDRATIDNTIISDGVKIDNLCQIAHNVFIGKNTVIASQTGIAGGAIIGNFCILAGQVGVADHAIIGDQVIVAAKTGLTTKNYGSGKILASGLPASERADYRRLMVYIKKLPEVYKKLGL